MATERFVAAWPNTYLYDGPSAAANRVTECLWGDWVSLREDEQVQGNRVPVHTRGTDGWLGTTELMHERPLEVNFVDVGQGDGAFIVTPDDGRILIDAGGVRQHVSLSQVAIQPAPRSRCAALRTGGDHASGRGPLRRVPPPVRRSPVPLRLAAAFRDRRAHRRGLPRSHVQGRDAQVPHRPRGHACRAAHVAVRSRHARRQAVSIAALDGARIGARGIDHVHAQG